MTLSAGPESVPFQTCLLLAPRGAPTEGFVRALRLIAFAVVKRPSEPPFVALATSGEFELIAWLSREPGVDGAALRRIHAAGQPLVVLLEEATPGLVAEALASGADAWLPTAASEEMVLAQVQAVFRRRQPTAPPTTPGLVRVGDLTVDRGRDQLERSGQPVALTRSEFRLIAYMADHAGRALRAHDILNAVTSEYQYSPREAQAVFKVYVGRIRRKLEPDPQRPIYLITVRGFGYRLEGSASALTGAVSGPPT